MKILIDIPEGWLQPLRNINLISWDSEILSICYRDYKDSKKFKDLEFITLPDNATNGDMIKAMFPNTRIYESGLDHLSVEVRIGEYPAELTMNVSGKWWDSPYRKEQE